MFPQEVQTEVAMRIAAMDRTAPEVLREVETVMERKLSSLINQDLEAAGGVKALVDIMNYVRPGHRAQRARVPRREATPSWPTRSAS